MAGGGPGGAATDRDASTLTVGEYLEGWLTDTLPRTVEASTLFSYRANIERHVTPWAGGVKRQKLTGPNPNRLYGQLSEPGANLRSPDRGLSTRTIRYIHTILHRALGDAVRHGLLARNPADVGDPPSQRGTATSERVKVWSGNELGTFLARSEAEDDRDFPIWRLIASTGMRRGEAIGLRWCDTDIDARTVAALRSHRKRQLKTRLLMGLGSPLGTDLVFSEISGAVLHPEALSKRFDRRVKRYGLPHIGVHGLRHSWATPALRAGVHPRVVQQRLGHSTIAVTLGICSHVTDGMDLGAAEQVAALFDGPVVTRL